LKVVTMDHGAVVRSSLVRQGGLRAVVGAVLFLLFGGLWLLAFVSREPGTPVLAYLPLALVLMLPGLWAAWLAGEGLAECWRGYHFRRPTLSWRSSHQLCPGGQGEARFSVLAASKREARGLRLHGQLICRETVVEINPDDIANDNEGSTESIVGHARVRGVMAVGRRVEVDLVFAIPANGLESMSVGDPTGWLSGSSVKWFLEVTGVRSSRRSAAARFPIVVKHETSDSARCRVCGRPRGPEVAERG
jgi:hypothetical protein